jgi:SAM-dependent methyltransferase
VTDQWADRAFLRGRQYRTDANLSARQSIYAYQHPRIDLAATVLDLVGPLPAGTIVDVGCGNGMYLAELAKRDFRGRVLGVDLSPGMLAAARRRLSAAARSDAPGSDAAGSDAAGSGAPGSGAPGSDGARSDAAGSHAARAVALAVADATALPVGDASADLVLAPHMLYHVPEPADAVRELRRVTRPGGRVVIVLNGTGHLRQLRAAVAAARGDAPAALGERVTLDDGESLANACFAKVTRHDFVSELRVPALEPIADYVRSMSGTGRAADPKRLVETAVAAFPITADGHYIITSHSGCLVCVAR